MATKRTKKAATTTRKAGTAKAKGTATRAKATQTKAKAKTQDGPTKREQQQAQNAELRERVVELRAADQSWSEIAGELNITPGKAQFLMMQHTVSKSPKLRLKHTDDESLVERIVEAREANDAHSSWGWIAARTGVSEGKIKALATEAGIPVAGSNIAVARAEANGSTKKSDKKTGTQRTTKRTTGKAKAATGKATAARKRASKRAGKTSAAS